LIRIFPRRYSKMIGV